MDLLLILTYTALCVVVFKVFKIPLNKWPVPTAAWTSHGIDNTAHPQNEALSKASGDNHFLFTMQRRCFGMRNAMGIGIKDTMSRVCADGFGEIVYRDMGRIESCRIATIEAVTSKEDAKGLVKDRKDAKSDD